LGITRPQEIGRYSFCYSTPADGRRRQPHDRRTAQLELLRKIQSDPGNALTWTFNPKVQGSRPWRPTESPVQRLYLCLSEIEQGIFTQQLEDRLHVCHLVPSP
jgi:hypothetical protein